MCREAVLQKQDAKTILLQEKWKQLKTAIHSAVIRRQMLLDLKAKYAGMVVCKNLTTFIVHNFDADGQKIAVSTGF